MENLPFILVIVMAGLVYAAYFWAERTLYEERTLRRILRERESIATRMLFDCWEKLRMSDSHFINKDDVMNTLVTVLSVKGYQVTRHDSVPADSSADSDGGV